MSNWSAWTTRSRCSALHVITSMYACCGIQKLLGTCLPGPMSPIHFAAPSENITAPGLLIAALQWEIARSTALWAGNWADLNPPQIKVRWAGANPFHGLLKLRLQIFSGSWPGCDHTLCSQSRALQQNRGSKQRGLGEEERGGNNLSRHPTVHGEHLATESAYSGTATNCCISAFPYLAKNSLLLKQHRHVTFRWQLIGMHKIFQR